MSIPTTTRAPLADRLVARSWDDDVDDRSRELLEEAATVLRLQAAALADVGIVVVTDATIPEGYGDE